ncbi:hypothetical protein G1K57_12250 [Tenacibaculum finnmarkense]|uniref:hypothetical protein n=1 Tax=Tenacibaculum finnmarkense TaxID=2781243 RepID=UPI001EFABD36|nr:hypothetical protein [Tenacibaculum finnmarkense]MCG8750507.1 hypothetical protein [Tenacibaculum finnmarkense]MCG8755511.1 hypothetical protein [Tenacibaculum finnmarkense]MCG8784096.1 hypothetical protein [Tenacibaculum finnmarkense]MCG8796682.1 hypothetical protein [Tenacibaculum finnmarkense]MCG8798977.1 hypothetical protein [Tenacibaculum finnmarkense]
MKERNLMIIATDVLYGKPEIHFAQFEKLMNTLLSLYTKRIEKKETQFDNERLYYINLLTQKFFLHGFSIKKLIDGINLESSDQNLNLDVLDPFSIHCLVRALIENYLVQNYLSNSYLEDDLLQLRFEIWMRYGLKQRNINTEDEYLKKVNELDNKAIEFLEKSINNRKAYLELSEDKKKSLYRTLKKEWKIIFDKEKFYPVSWNRLMKEAGIKEEIRENIYNFLSWHAHSQSISILQLKDMWENNSEKDTVLILVKKINMFISFIISDIVKVDDKFKQSYDDLHQEYKDLINFFNLSYRGSEYIIEQQ